MTGYKPGTAKKTHRSYPSRMYKKPAADIYGNGHTPLYRDFVRALREKGRPLVDGAAGFRSMQTVLAIYASHKRGEKVSLRSFRFSTGEMHRTKPTDGGR